MIWAWLEVSLLVLEIIPDRWASMLTESSVAMMDYSIAF